ncbi:MAG: hypothetical protein Q8L48_20100 [Archangium sp.]|nr:hypothetical protein [Archangium sp.]
MSDEGRELRCDFERLQVVLRAARQRRAISLAQVSEEVAEAVASLQVEVHALGARRAELQRRVAQERVASLARKLALAARNEQAQWHAAYRGLASIALVAAASFVAVQAAPVLSWPLSLALSLPLPVVMGRIGLLVGRSLRPRRLP